MVELIVVVIILFCVPACIRFLLEREKEKGVWRWERRKEGRKGKREVGGRKREREIGIEIVI